MAYDYEGRGEDIEVNGTTYHIPKLDDLAHAPLAFEDYSNSIPFSEYIVTETVTADTVVDDSYNGKMIVAQADITLTFGTLQNGFSVACVADGEYTISYEGVDKENQQTQAYEVATVVTVNDRNILSVARAESDSIIIDQGPAEGTPPAPILVDSEGNSSGDAYEGGSVIYFQPGTPNANQGNATFHAAKIRKVDGSELTTEEVFVEQYDYEVSVVGTEMGVDYVVDLYGVNDEGKGESVTTNTFQLNYNVVIGNGKYSEIDDYNDSGEKWALMEYISSNANWEFTVDESYRDFKILVVGGGGGGGSSSTHGSHYGGLGGGGAAVEDQRKIAPGTYPIGAASGGGQAGTGGTTTFLDLTAPGGTGGSNCHDSGCNNGTSGGPGVRTYIRGKEENFPNKYNCCPANACNYATWSNGNLGIGGGGHHASVGNCAPPGCPGAVIIAWKISDNTTREITKSRLEKKAYTQGVEFGYTFAQSEMKNEIEELGMQLSAVGTSDV